jgi:hypothetical protein
MSFNCAKCPFTATTYYKLQQHIQKDHNNVVYKCDKCNKIFVSKLGLEKHESSGCKTDKDDPLECKYCLEHFNNRSSKCRHLKICPCKVLEDSTHLDQQSEQVEDVSSVLPIVFEMAKHKQTMFRTDHITNSDIINMLLDFYDENDANSHLHVFVQYSNRLFHNPLNQCIAKPNISLSSSRVHNGNGQWSYWEDTSAIAKCKRDIIECLVTQLTQLSQIETDFTHKLKTILIPSLISLKNSTNSGKTVKYMHKSIVNIIRTSR